MRVIKRDGKIVEYNPEKIVMALLNASSEVDLLEQIDDYDIHRIIRCVEL